jgi:LysR family hydrogen peroxide-inducible transcriptional activator
MLYEYQTDPMLEKLHSGEIDVGILALGSVSLDGLDSYELYKEPFMVAMPAAHRLAQRSAIKVDDLSHETLLLLDDGHCLRDQALDICSSADVHEKQDFRATSLETLRQMVAAGVGITLLPELAGRGAYGNARGVAIKPFVKPVPTRTIGAVWRKSSARRAAILALCKLVEAHAL